MDGPATYVMSIDAVFHITLLTTGTGVETSQMSYGADLLRVGLILVFKAAFVPLCTGSAEVVVIA